METPQSQNSTMSGGPSDPVLSQSAQSPTSTTPASAVTSAASPPAQTTETKPNFQPVYIGGRKFETSESLAAYTSELDRQRSAWEKQQEFTNRSNAASDPDKEIADLMFEDTTAAVKILTEKAERQAMAKFEQKIAQQNAVTTFYQKYEDLKEFSDLVDLTANKLSGKIKDMPQEDAMEMIAKEARSRISSIRGTPSGGVELPSGPARVANGTGGPATPVQVTTESENLIDQIRRYQTRGKTKGGN